MLMISNQDRNKLLTTKLKHVKNTKGINIRGAESKKSYLQITYKKTREP